MNARPLIRFFLISVLFSISLGSTPPPAEAWQAVTAGWYHTCALRNDNTVACWGYNNEGEATPPSGTFKQLGAGFWNTCGVQTGGLTENLLTCWGDNSYGQSPPVFLLSIQQAAGGEFTSCGLTLSRSAVCWGLNTPGIDQRNPPPEIFLQIDSGDNHSCGVRTGLLEGLVACWGFNNHGQATPPSGNFSQVSGGNEYTCGVRADGTLSCWGTNTDGQKDPPSGTFTQVSAGGFHTCAIKTDGTMACWGLKSSGQATPPSGTFTQVSAGGFHTCGLRTDGTLACWGANGFGQAPALTLSPISLAEGAIGQAYSQTISAAGGAAPYTFAFTAGNPPPGLSLNTGGSLSGKPTAIGTYGFTVTATDSKLFSAQLAYSLTVTNQPIYLPLYLPLIVQ